MIIWRRKAADQSTSDTNADKKGDISKTERRRKMTKTGRKRANIRLFKSVGGMEMKQREVEKN